MRTQHNKLEYYNIDKPTTMSKVTIDLNAPLLEFYKAGIITALNRKGNPPPMYYKYYECFATHVEKGNGRSQAQKLAADDCGVDERTIRNAIKAIEETKLSGK